MFVGFMGALELREHVDDSPAGGHQAPPLFNGSAFSGFHTNSTPVKFDWNKLGVAIKEMFYVCALPTFTPFRPLESDSAFSS